MIESPADALPSRLRHLVSIFEGSGSVELSEKAAEVVTVDKTTLFADVLEWKFGRRE